MVELRPAPRGPVEVRRIEMSPAQVSVGDDSVAVTVPVQVSCEQEFVEYMVYEETRTRSLHPGPIALAVGGIAMTTVGAIATRRSKADIVPRPTPTEELVLFFSVSAIAGAVMWFAVAPPGKTTQSVEEPGNIDTRDSDCEKLRMSIWLALNNGRHIPGEVEPNAFLFAVSATDWRAHSGPLHVRISTGASQTSQIQVLAVPAGTGAPAEAEGDPAQAQ